MADYPAYIIERAGNLILDCLTETVSVPFSQFYDGDPEHAWLLNKLCPTKKERSLYEYSVATLIDLAVHDLSRQGIVEKRELKDQLHDGTQDYSIYLTPKGRSLLSDRSRIKYDDVYL